jgi:DNA-binding GntR family transcriptional regulator
MSAATAGALRALMDEPSDEATAEEATTTALRRAILQGVLRPGDRLRQETLAAELGVSRIPLRDAFRRLEAEGLIRIDGRRGARVATLTAEDVAELYELRRLLEVHCIRLAIRNLTGEGTAELLALASRMDAHVGHDTPGVVSQRTFYSTLYGWSGRQRMTSLILQLRHELNRYHSLKDVPLETDIHARIGACVAAHDADGAGAAMREHLRVSRDRLLSALRRDARVRRPKGRRPRRSTTAEAR